MPDIAPRRLEAVDAERLAPLFPMSPVHRAVVEEARRTREEAEAIVRAARDEADAIVAEARASAEAARVDARRQARQAALEEIAPLLESLRRHVIDTREDIEARVEGLAIDLARRATGIELSHRPGAFADVVRAQLRDACRYDSITIRCHPDQAPMLREAIDEPIETDESLDPWTCRIETEFGDLVGDIEAAFDRLETALFEETP